MVAGVLANRAVLVVDCGHVLEQARATRTPRFHCCRRTEIGHDRAASFSEQTSGYSAAGQTGDALLRRRTNFFETGRLRIVASTFFTNDKIASPEEIGAGEASRNLR